MQATLKTAVYFMIKVYAALNLKWMVQRFKNRSTMQLLFGTNKGKYCIILHQIDSLMHLCV